MNQSNELDLVWIINVILRRKWLIIGLLVLALLVSGAVMMYLPATYKATATLMIEPSEKSTTSELNVLMAGERLALTYSQIIVSRPVLEQVIEELGLDLTPSALGKKVTIEPITDTHLVRITVSNASPIWVVLVANTISEKFITYVDTLSAETYSHSLDYMQLSINQKQAEIGTILTDIETENSRRAELANELSELELQLSENRYDYQTLQQNAQSLELSITQTTNRIHIVEPAQLENQSANPPYTAVLLMFLDQEILFGNAGYTGQVSNLIAQVYAPMLVRASILENVINQLQLNETSEELQDRILVSTVPGTQFLELRVSDEGADNAIQIANTLASIFIEQNQIALAAPYHTQLMTIETEMNSLTSQMTEIQDAIKSISTEQTAVDLELERLNGELTIKYADRRDLQNSYDQLILEAERSSNTIVISEPASQSSKQSQNSILYVGLSVIVAGILGAGAAFLLEHIEDKVRTQDDVEALLARKPIGVIGRIERGKDKLILGANSSPIVAEDFRKLSAIIRPAIEGVPLRKLLVTSPYPGEGKSTVAANLAIVIAKTGSKVILVDADMHRPQISRLFDLEAETGLSEFLSSKRKTASLTGCTHQNLSILTSGATPDDSIQLLSSPKLGDFLDTLTEKSDLVIIDCPPILTLADASFLTPLVDGVLMVITSGISDRKATVEAMALLKMAKLPFIGIVLNSVSSRSNSYYQYYQQEHKKEAASEIEQQPDGPSNAPSE